MKQMEALSITDDLTKVYNSRHFYVQLKTETERAVRYNRPISLMFMDIDSFKYYNDINITMTLTAIRKETMS